MTQIHAVENVMCPRDGTPLFVLHFVPGELTPSSVGISGARGLEEDMVIVTAWRRGGGGKGGPNRPIKIQSARAPRAFESEGKEWGLADPLSLEME